MRRGIRGAQEIEQAGLPVFATVNFSPEAANLRKQKGKLPILAATKPDDLVIEALRSLRTSLHFGMLDAKTNTILLTSAAPGAGKSFTAVNLAAVAAQAGQKVCLVDADLRRGYLRRFVGREKGTPGLAELLAKEKTLDEVLIQSPIDGLSFITSGRYPPNPSELLMRAEFEALLQTLNGRFDLIIVDSPPALAVTDPVVIGRYTGATILVARHHETVMGEVEAVRRTDANDPYNVTADELRQFIERFEQLESEKKDVTEQQKELMAEAKGRGYDTKVMRKVIALRKRKPDDIAEEEAVLELYKAALGMA
jgi:tyrosine-protein kinase Etk/Wzc